MSLIWFYYFVFVWVYRLRVGLWRKLSAFELWCWRRLLRGPLNCKKIQPVHSKGDQSWVFLEGMMLKLKLHLMRRVDHWKRLWCWEGLGAGGEGDARGWDGWMASLTRWTWVWVNSGSWWWTGCLACCDLWDRKSRTWLSDWTELNWILYLIQFFKCSFFFLG